MFSSLNFPCLVSPVGCECWLSQSVSAAVTVREGEQRTENTLIALTPHRTQPSAHRMEIHFSYFLSVFNLLLDLRDSKFLDCFSFNLTGGGGII